MDVKIIPIDTPFLPFLVKWLLKKHLKLLPDFSNICIVFPSQRNKYWFRRYLLDASNKKGIVPPILFTIEEFKQFIYEKLENPPKYILKDIERNLILKIVVNKMRKNYKPSISFAELSFIRFIAIGQKLLKFLDELEQEDISIKNLVEKKELLHFPPKYIDEELPILEKIKENYDKMLAQKGVIDKIKRDIWINETLDCRDRSLDLSDDKVDRPEGLSLQYSQLYFAGFIIPTKIESSIIKKIASFIPTTLILHSELNKLDKLKELNELNEIGNPFYLHTKLLKNLDISTPVILTLSVTKKNLKNRDSSVALLPQNDTVSHITTHIYIQKIPDEIQQTYSIINILYPLLRKYLPSRIGIILPDQDFYLPIKQALEQHNIPYNLSMGIPLTHSPLYSFLHLLINVLQTKTCLTTGRFHTKEFLAFLKHPFMKGIKDFRGKIYEIERTLLKNNLRYIDLKIRNPRLPKNLFGGQANDEIRKNKDIFDFVTHIIDIVIQDKPFKEYVSQITDLLIDIINLNKIKITPGIKEFIENLSEIEEIEFPEHTEFIGTGLDKLKLILEVLKTRTYRTFGDPFTGVQIIGVLEARNLDFDAVIMPDMNEGIFPRESEKDLFIPQQLRKEVGLPYYKERETLFAYYFEQAKRGKKEVYLLYIENPNQQKTKSRFLINEN